MNKINRRYISQSLYALSYRYQRPRNQQIAMMLGRLVEYWDILQGGKFSFLLWLQRISVVIDWENFVRMLSVLSDVYPKREYSSVLYTNPVA